MDIATIIGWLLSIGAVALLIVDQDQIQMFFGSRTAVVSIIFVLGGTVFVTAVIFLLLLADQKKSRALYEDMVRRKRARRERSEAGTRAPA